MSKIDYTRAKDIHLDSELYYLDHKNLDIFSTKVKSISRYGTDLIIIPQCLDSRYEKDVPSVSIQKCSITLTEYPRTTYYTDKRLAYTQLVKIATDKWLSSQNSVTAAIESSNKCSAELIRVIQLRERHLGEVGFITENEES